MKRILLITMAVSVPGEKYYNRTVYLYELLLKKGYEVTLVTTKFNHYDKKFRDINQFKKNYPNYDFHFLDAPGYKKNISILRVLNLFVFSKNLKKWLNNNGRNYDLVFSTMPSHEVVNVAGDFCNRNNIPLVIDVRDLWPEAMKLLVKNDFLFNLIFYRMKIKANQAYSKADEIVAVSNEYLERALKANNKSRNPQVVYLGATLDKFDKGVQNNIDKIHKGNDEIWITYIGTLGVSYDIETLIKSYDLILKKGYCNVKLKIIGKGPLLNKFMKFAQERNIGVDFIGYQEYEVMAAYLKKSDIAINAIKKNAAQSVINKVADYFAAGIPILNGSLSPDMKYLIEHYNTGLNYIPEDYFDLSAKMEYLLNNPSWSKEFGNNGRKLAESEFDRSVSYLKIVKLIDGLL